MGTSNCLPLMSQSACSIALIPANTTGPPPLAQNVCAYISPHSASIRDGSAPRRNPSARSLIMPAAAVAPVP